SLADIVRNVSIGWASAISGFQSGWDLHGERFKRWAGPITGLLLLALCIGLMGPSLAGRFRIWLRVKRVRRGQASAGDASLLYARMLQVVKRHGYQKPAWFTPLEFAQSLSRTPLAAAVDEFTETYNILRFGG